MRETTADKVVVTGGAGFIGSAVVRALLERGAEVVVVDRNPAPFDDPRVSAIEGDLTDPAVRAAAVTPGVNGVVHCAAITSVLKTVEMPAETYTENVEVTAGLLELCRQHQVPRFLLASTNAVVGDVGTGTITPDLPLMPLTPYGATKAAAEMLMSGYAGSYGIATAALRFTNVYGPGMGHKDSFIPRLMKAALSGDTVRIYGTGEQVRDLVYLDDVVNGVLLAWDAQYTGRVILGSGSSVSVLDMIETVRQVTGAELPAEHVEAPKGEMPAVVVDVSGSDRAIGYRPTTTLADGLAQVWADFQRAAAAADTATP